MCFGNTHIRITDIDGAVERNGKFLIIETKLPGQDPPKGQEIFLDGLSKQPDFTVIVVWGNPNQPIAMQVWGKSKRLWANTERLQRLIRRWFEWADSQRKSLPSGGGR